MPRGNDTTLAVSELHNQYGPYENADELIRGHKANQDPAVIRAGVLPVDEDATAEWKSKRDEAAEKLGVGADELLLDLAVRGNALSGVIQTADGGVRKAVTGANDRYVAPVLPPSEVDDRERHSRDQAIAAEVARLRATADAELAVVKAQLQDEQATALAQIRAELGLGAPAAPEAEDDAATDGAGDEGAEDDEGADGAEADDGGSQEEQPKKPKGRARKLVEGSEGKGK